MPTVEAFPPPVRWLLLTGGRHRPPHPREAPGSTCLSCTDTLRCNEDPKGRRRRMAMTAAVKDELSRLAVTKPCCRKAEVASVFRYGGSLHIVGGRIAIEADLDTGAAARRLRKDIWEVYSHRADLVIQSPGGLRRGHRYQLRVTQG